MNIKVINS